MSSPTAPGNSSETPDEGEETLWDSTGFMSVTTASSKARVSDETIRSWFDKGEIKGFRDDRGHRLIDRSSLDRRLRSIGVVEASRLVDRSPYTIREWFDHGYVDGYLTPAGRRRIFRASIDEYARLLAEQQTPMRFQR
jgi:excisionase family DNA binding protein